MRSSRGSGSCCRRIPTMPATVIAERIGWTRSIRTLQWPGRASCGRCICRRTRRRAPAMWPGRSRSAICWFPPIELPVGFGQVRTADAAAGADDGDRLLAVAVGGADPDPDGGGSVRRLVAADRAAGGGAAGAGLGRGGRGRPVARRARRADRGTARRSAARWATKVHDLQAGRPGGQGPDRARP